MRTKSSKILTFLSIALAAGSIGLAFGSYNAIKEAQANLQVQRIMGGGTPSTELMNCMSADEFGEFSRINGLTPVGRGLNTDEQSIIGILEVDEYFYVTEMRPDGTVCILRSGNAWYLDPALKGLPV